MGGGLQHVPKHRDVRFWGRPRARTTYVLEPLHSELTAENHQNLEKVRQRSIAVPEETRIRALCQSAKLKQTLRTLQPWQTAQIHKDLLIRKLPNGSFQALEPSQAQVRECPRRGHSERIPRARGDAEQVCRFDYSGGVKKNHVPQAFSSEPTRETEQDRLVRKSEEAAGTRGILETLGSQQLEQEHQFFEARLERDREEYLRLRAMGFDPYASSVGEVPQTKIPEDREVINSDDATVRSPGETYELQAETNTMDVFEALGPGHQRDLHERRRSREALQARIRSEQVATVHERWKGLHSARSTPRMCAPPAWQRQDQKQHPLGFQQGPRATHLPQTQADAAEQAYAAHDERLQKHLELGQKRAEEVKRQSHAEPRRVADMLRQRTRSEVFVGQAPKAKIHAAQKAYTADTEAIQLCLERGRQRAEEAKIALREDLRVLDEKLRQRQRTEGLIERDAACVQEARARAHAREEKEKAKRQKDMEGWHAAYVQEVPERSGYNDQPRREVMKQAHKLMEEFVKKVELACMEQLRMWEDGGREQKVEKTEQGDERVKNTRGWGQVSGVGGFVEDCVDSGKGTEATPQITKGVEVGGVSAVGEENAEHISPVQGPVLDEPGLRKVAGGGKLEEEGELMGGEVEGEDWEAVEREGGVEERSRGRGWFW